jgi:cytochrome c oxidase subunit IV
MDHDHHHTTTTVHAMTEGEHSPKEYLKFVGVIVVISLIAALLYSGGWQDYLRVFMGVFFVVFAGFKFAGYQMFALMFAGYDIVAKRIKVYGYAYPFIELLLGILYLTDFVPLVRDLVTIVIMAVGSIGVLQEIKRRSGVHCACLGNVIKLPLSTVSLVEDVGMGLMALVMLLWR